MKIRVLIDNKKGSSILLERHFGLLKSLIQRYPNALWRKFKDKKGMAGYELDV